MIARTETLTAGATIVHEGEVAELTIAPVWEPLQDGYMVVLWFPASRKHETVYLPSTVQLAK